MEVRKDVVFVGSPTARDGFFEKLNQELGQSDNPNVFSKDHVVKKHNNNTFDIWYINTKEKSAEYISGIMKGASQVIFSCSEQEKLSFLENNTKFITDNMRFLNYDVNKSALECLNPPVARALKLILNGSPETKRKFMQELDQSLNQEHEATDAGYRSRKCKNITFHIYWDKNAYEKFGYYLSTVETEGIYNVNFSDSNNDLFPKISCLKYDNTKTPLNNLKTLLIDPFASIEQYCIASARANGLFSPERKQAEDKMKAVSRITTGLGK